MMQMIVMSSLIRITLRLFSFIQIQLGNVHHLPVSNCPTTYGALDLCIPANVKSRTQAELGICIYPESH